MPFVNFHPLQDLTPAAFKLYVYFLDQVQTRNTAVFAIPLVDLGYESGLQPPCPYPAFRHGKDGKLGTLHSKAKVVDSLSVTPWVWLDLGRIRPLEPSV